MAEMWIKNSFFTVIVPLLAPTLGELGLPCFKHWGGGRGPPFPTPLYHCPYKAYIKASVPSTTINPLFQRFNYSLVFIFKSWSGKFITIPLFCIVL